MVCSESCQSEIVLKKVFSIQKRQVYRSWHLRLRQVMQLEMISVVLILRPQALR